MGFGGGALGGHSRQFCGPFLPKLGQFGPLTVKKSKFPKMLAFTTFLGPFLFIYNALYSEIIIPAI